jgi:hypothetical protein
MSLLGFCMVSSLKYTIIHASFASRLATATSRDKIGTSLVALMALFGGV